MKKSAWIALFLLSMLAGVFFVIRDEPKTSVRAPMTIESVDQLGRVEIVPPGSARGGELIVLENQAGTWQMTRPHQSELSPSTQATLGGLFAKDIRTDDLALSIDKIEKYGLDAASAVKLSAYSRGSEDAALELEIGKEISVAQTGARRTYLKKTGEEEPYRAQMALGDFVRQSADELRLKSMVELDPEAFMDVTITHRDGAETRIVRELDAWELVGPLLGAESMNKLDQKAVARLNITLARVRAVDFADEKDPAEVGLEPARVTVAIETIDDQRHVLEVGDEAEGGKVYARFDDGVVFTVAKSVADRVSLKVDSLKDDVEKVEKAVEE
jgi:hypothetical protein